MRLIDADELKKSLSDKDNITWTHEYGDAIPLEWIMSTIDNAPTVESPLTELCDEYCKKCPIEDENECTDCLIPKIRGFIRSRE